MAEPQPNLVPYMTTDHKNRTQIIKWANDVILNNKRRYSSGMEITFG